MFKTKLIALAGAGVAAGALALGAAGTAGAVVTPVSVTANPTSIHGTQGTAISPVDITVTLDQHLTDNHATVVTTAAGLPAGVTLGSNDVISGVPTVKGNGNATVTATATETETTGRYLIDLSKTDAFDASNCNYALNGPTSFTVFQSPDQDGTLTIGITGLSLDPKTGIFSYNVVTVDNDGVGNVVTTTVTGTAYGNGEVITGPSAGEEGQSIVKDLSSQFTVTKVCTGSVVIPWALDAAPQPNPTVTVTPPPPSTPLSGVPSGGVQTGGGLPVSHSDQGLFVLLGSLALLVGGYPLARRWVKRQGS